MNAKLIAALAVAVGVTGSLDAAGAAGTAPGRRATPVTVHTSKYGRVLFDGSGRSLYLFDKDRRGASSCYGACAREWPPLLTKGAPHGARGVRAALLATTRRRDGSLQVTYARHPLYGFAGDRGRGQITFQNGSDFGARWHVLTPAGKPVR